ncbi:protein L-isoaspartate O-methyltransferase [Citrifermentans bemidjiense Bem]|uniref:Protein-L-isoaspartate O-methyltransferase n=1 Tax=Citrifermentans bemidjiense (strain ATCC BAA-1014 / DSM 16622 / JCM 12645 / Bem) TaxID=404380 RepID=B5EHF4_CITBB|nr:protein-L-isoaspartate(D-aspartate) O-methyltransferase [Citrifermentans bemidjiense]ACH39690.2 protein L-isoaspartate O-methyltransferase [Citrifermentans bemidjiense Bem]
MNSAVARKRMVAELVKRGITDQRVLGAMQEIPRHIFVEEAMSAQAYSDGSLPIGEKQTISQPYIVAKMTQLLALTGREKVLELGTGSGYQAAVLATLADRVCTVERIRPLALKARKALDSLRLLNVNLKIGDGTEGWAEEAPFDAILVTAGAPHLPDCLVQQLAPGGRLVIPVGDRIDQKLLLVTKGMDGSVATEECDGCRFVRLIGRNGWNDEQ